MPESVQNRFSLSRSTGRSTTRPPEGKRGPEPDLPRPRLLATYEEPPTKRNVVAAGRATESQAFYLSLLDHILGEEVAAWEKRRIKTALKIAGLPFAKTIEEYDVSFHLFERLSLTHR